MVLTGTGPGRGKHGEDVHFKEDVAVFICICVQARARIREGIYVIIFLFEFFQYTVCMQFILAFMRVHAYSSFSAAMCNGVCSLGFALEQNT